MVMKEGEGQDWTIGRANNIKNGEWWLELSQPGTQPDRTLWAELRVALIQLKLNMSTDRMIPYKLYYITGELWPLQNELDLLNLCHSCEPRRSLKGILLGAAGDTLINLWMQNITVETDILSRRSLSSRQNLSTKRWKQSSGNEHVLPWLCFLCFVNVSRILLWLMSPVKPLIFRESML